MSRLAVIGTFYGRHEQSFPLAHRLLVDSTRKPDELWLMCEEPADVKALQGAFDELRELELLDDLPSWVRLVHCPTPREKGRYTVIPYSHKINAALDDSDADLFVYLDNGSMPSALKFEQMTAALDANPDWGAVYCTQKRTGFDNVLNEAIEPVDDAYCRLNYTQVMHRRTADRWPLDLKFADPDFADGVFWRSLHGTLGPFHPAGGTMVLDDHHIPDAKAAGI